MNQVAPRVLVTGGRGFVGRRLIARMRRDHPDWRIETPAGPQDAARGDALDICDAASVEAWMQARPPDLLVHLAAVSAVTAANRDPRLAWRTNLDGTLNLVLALRQHAPEAFMLHVSTAEVYGASLSDRSPTDEGALLQPLNPYAASKAAADLLVRQAAAEGLRAVCARPFNHTGPGQAEVFVAPSFAGQIARIEAGLQPPVLKVGALDDERDFLDVEDVVDAYLALLHARERLNPGDVYNVASGAAVRIGELLTRLLAMAERPIEVEVDSSRLRPTPTPRAVGDAGRLRDRLSWAPRVPLDQTLAGVLEERRRALTSSAAPL